MDAAAELGRNPVSKTISSLSMEMSRLTRDGTTAEPVSQDQILRRERGQGNIHFPCSADHLQDWQPYPVDPYSCYMCNHTYMVLLCFVWCSWMAINVSVQFNGGFLRDIILLTQCYYHRGTRLNAMKRICLCGL